jgi:calpain-15
MATLDSAIVIEDDDSDNDSPKHKQAVGLVQTFMEILNVNQATAVRELDAADLDLEVALARYLERRSVSAVEIVVDVNEKKEEDLDQTKPSPQIEPSQVQVGKKPQKAANIKCHSPNPILSSQWYDCLRNSSTPFVDPDYPPTRTSLDGRREPKDDEKTAAAVLCLCKLPACARTVQSDGPNYGRFYLACGQKNSRRRPRSSQDDTNNDNDETDNANDNVAKSKTATPKNNKLCNFFQWDKDGSRGSGYNTQWSSLAWHSFASQQYVLYHKQISSSQVRQGAVGNCWFLSALAVVAEQPYLVHQQLLPHSDTNEKGCYQINLCLDGKWTPILVDANLPVVYGSASSSNSDSQLAKQDFRGGATLQGGSSVAYPAFCATPSNQLWPALVEKAYAKAHGCYSNLSGGFIAEGLADLTGAPTETIILERVLYDMEELWARLLSFYESGFLLGVATSQGGDGLVGGHAYSVLNIQEITDSLVGEQPKVTDFFGGPASPSKKPKPNPGQPERSTIRLVRIRNPWGKREWKGAWSVHSEQWTKHLRDKLGSEAWAKNDGTFWMSFDDMFERFHHMDVCKTREGWVHASVDGALQPRDPMLSSKYIYTLTVQERTWAFISILQPKKRANATTRYWYCDPSMVIMKRRRNATEWECEASNLTGVARRSECEVFLDPDFEYCVMPFAGLPKINKTAYPFRLTSYSSTPVEVNSAWPLSPI